MEISNQWIYFSRNEWFRNIRQIFHTGTES